ncbi:MAG: RHS repeat-associated core domain-containing protein [Clostridia bacterium]|nr:RHS repeat-associated core domain-containing protein [Clostridia bacterium]
MTWSNGRNLASYHVPGDGIYFDMKYTADGKRVEKRYTYDDDSTDETTITYFYNGNNLVCEKTDVGGSISRKYYLYNSQGIVGFAIGSTVYTYRKNLFGDIVAIYNGSTKVAEYAYDAYGKCTIVTDTNYIGRDNPFRYRGYYWDNDLQLYYLMSRYYDPVTSRFINADKLSSLYWGILIIGGSNLYAYCLNNPIMYIDDFGLKAKRNRNIPVNKLLNYRIDEKGSLKEHIHVTYQSKGYTWYRYSHNKRHENKEGGLSELSKSAQKELKKAGVPEDYFNNMTYIDVDLTRYIYMSPVDFQLPNYLITPINNTDTNNILVFPHHEREEAENIVIDPAPPYVPRNPVPFPLPSNSIDVITTITIVTFGAGGLALTKYRGLDWSID